MRRARKPVSANSNPDGSTALLDYTSLRLRKIISSRTTLHRYLKRSADQNPFPTPCRHTETGRRYWSERDVLAWVKRERERTVISADSKHLVRDMNPAVWSPGRPKRGISTELGNTIFDSTKYIHTLKEI